MIKRATISCVLLFICAGAFSQDLPNERAPAYNDFAVFMNDWLKWYVALSISRDWESGTGITKKNFDNSISKFAEAMYEKHSNAIDKSKSDFREKILHANFINEVKVLLEHMYQTDGELVDWTTFLDENGFSLEKYGYNNIERIGYNLQLFINCCIFYDLQTNEYELTETIITKMEKNLRDIRRRNSGR